MSDPWFTDSSCPKITDETTTQTERLTIFWGTTSKWKRTITTTQSRWLHLTQAAADSIAAAKSTDTSDTVANISTRAASVRENDAGAYSVRITETRTPKAWSSDS
jgi:hypothetical protein